MSTMVKSYYQTTDISVITKENGIVYSTGFEMRPALPTDIKLSDKPIKIKVTDNIIYTFFVNGVIERINKNVKTIWFPKPTIKDAVQYSLERPNSKGSFRFLKNGLVEAYCYDNNYIFCSEEETTPIEGTQIECNMCFCGEYIFTDELCETCDSAYDTDDCGCNKSVRCCGSYLLDPYDRD